MPIDWFTVGAQAINFMVLVWLLKRFLYHPILDGLAAREQKIKKILEDADASKTQAQLLKTELQQEHQHIEQERATILKQAKTEASKQGDKLYQQAQEAADNMLSQRMQALQQDIHNLQADVVRKSIAEVYAISKKVLIDLADLEIEQCMLSKLLNRIRDIDITHYDELTSALKRSNYKILVRSAFELNKHQQQAIQDCLQNKFGDSVERPIQLRFSQTPEFGNGIELSVSGWKIAWSTHNYLAELEQRVIELGAQYIQVEQAKTQTTSTKV